MTHRVHQYREDVAVFDHRLAQFGLPVRRRGLVARLKIGEALELALLLFVGGTRQFYFGLPTALGVEEGIHADDRVGTVVFLVFVIKRLFLDLAALIAGFHRAEHAAARRDRVEFLEHRLFHQVGEFINDEGTLIGVLVSGHAEFAVDDELDRHRPAHAFFGWRGHRFVVGVGVQAVAIVVDGEQRLQRGTDIVEIHLLRMQRTARGLHVILELLAAIIGAVLVLHRHRPDATRDAADYRVFRIHAVREEERQVGRKIVDLHAARQIALDVGETVRQGECELTDRVRAGFGDVITGDRHRVEILHLVMDEELLNVAHHLERKLGREDAGVLPLVFLENVGLHCAAHR